jgi:acetyl esterase/lipase
MKQRMTRKPKGTAALLTAAILAFTTVPTACVRSEPPPEPEATTDAWLLGSRTLPPPAAASDALRSAIANTPQPSVANHIQNNTFTTTKDWDQFIATRNETEEQQADVLAERFAVVIEESEIAGVPVYSLTPAEVEPVNEDRLFVHVHGGAYVLFARRAALPEAILIAHRARIPALSIDYRMPPEHPFPAAIEDVVAVWESLLQDRPAKSMALGGSSAGGGLTLASTLRFKELGLETPGALWAGTPWADLSDTSDSLHTNEGIDRTLVAYTGVLEGAAKLYAAGRDLRTPLISPVYGDFAGFPPTYLVTGTRDLFLSDVARVHRKMRVAGVVADLNVYEGSAHGDYSFVLDSPESEQTFGELGAFLLRHLE